MLTKTDLRQIRTVVKEEVKIRIDPLEITMRKGFKRLEKKVEKHLDLPPLAPAQLAYR